MPKLTSVKVVARNDKLYYVTLTYSDQNPENFDWTAQSFVNSGASYEKYFDAVTKALYEELKKNLAPTHRQKPLTEEASRNFYLGNHSSAGGHRNSYWQESNSSSQVYTAFDLIRDNLNINLPGFSRKN